MHEDFKKWISGLKIELDDASANAKWNGVVAAASAATGETVTELLQIVFALPKVKADLQAVETFVGTIKSHDEAFVGTGAETEIRLLAACTLVQIMASDGHIAAWTAMAVNTSLFDGRRTLTKLPVPLAHISHARLRELAETVSQRPSFAPVKPSAPKALTAPEAIDPATITKLVSTALSSAFAAANLVAEHHNRTMLAYEGFLKRQDEELQILWWVIGERCRVLDLPFEKLKFAQRPLIVAGELSELIEHLPGPPSAKAILSRTGLKDGDKVSLADAIAACGSEWVENNKAANWSPLLFPVHFAITRSAEADGAEWIPPFKTVTGIDAGAQVDVLTLAQQYLFEYLIMRLRA